MKLINYIAGIAIVLLTLYWAVSSDYVSSAIFLELITFRDVGIIIIALVLFSGPVILFVAATKDGLKSRIKVGLLSALVVISAYMTYYTQPDVRIDRLRDSAAEFLEKSRKGPMTDHGRDIRKESAWLHTFYEKQIEFMYGTSSAGKTRPFIYFLVLSMWCLVNLGYQVLYKEDE